MCRCTLIKSDLFERTERKKVFIMKCFLHVPSDSLSVLSYFMEYGVQVTRTVNPIISRNFVIVDVRCAEGLTDRVHFASVHKLMKFGSGISTFSPKEGIDF